MTVLLFLKRFSEKENPPNTTSKTAEKGSEFSCPKEKEVRIFKVEVTLAGKETIILVSFLIASCLEKRAELLAAWVVFGGSSATFFVFYDAAHRWQKTINTFTLTINFESHFRVMVE